MQAQSTQQPFLETFASMLQDELDRLVGDNYLGRSTTTILAG
jgi:hypothetical protein